MLFRSATRESKHRIKKIQWWQLLLQQGPVYIAKVPNQMGVGQYKNAASPLRTRGINTTHQHFQMRYKTLIYLKGLKSIG